MKPEFPLSGVFFKLLLVVMLVLVSNTAMAAKPWRISFETGPVWQNRNDVRIPGNTGTEFSLADLVGTGPFPYVRLELNYELNKKHSFRFLLAPFEYTESGVLDKNVDFAGQTFSAGETTEATYKFNSYRATWRYRFHDSTRWEWHIGATLKIRDADIRLKQAGVTANDSDLGVVPLVNLYGEFNAGNHWRLVLDLDGLASPQGRAIDLGLLARYDIDREWYLAGGYRLLEGGGDNDNVYAFAWFNYLVLSAGYRF